MDEFLNISSLSRPGRRPEELNAKILRPLTVEDFLEASKVQHVGGAATVKKLKNSHHQVAKLLATGMAEAQVSIITGYTVNRISVLKADPSFQELLTHYSNMEAEQWKEARADMKERLVTLGFDAIEEIQDRLVENPETFAIKELVSVVELSADRTGHGKQTKVEATVNHAIDPETLARIRNSTPRASGVQLSEADRAALMGPAVLEAEFHPFTEAREGEQSEGDSI